VPPPSGKVEPPVSNAVTNPPPTIDVPKTLPEAMRETFQRERDQHLRTNLDRLRETLSPDATTMASLSAELRQEDKKWMDWFYQWKVQEGPGMEGENVLPVDLPSYRSFVDLLLSETDGRIFRILRSDQLGGYQVWRTRFNQERYFLHEEND
jgi:hypothetical protein